MNLNDVIPESDLALVAPSLTDELRLLRGGKSVRAPIAQLPPAPGMVDAIDDLTLGQAALQDSVVEYNGLKVNSAAALYPAAQAVRKLDVAGSLDIPETDGNLASYIDTVLTGSGRVTGLYRKNVIPDSAPDFKFSARDLLPRHMPQLQAAAAPVVVIVGDSISTYYANSNANVVGMLTECVRTEMRQQLAPRQVTFYDRAIGGTTYTDLDGKPTLATYPEWYTNTASSWLSYIQALNPDVVIFSFGMNPAGGIRTAIESIVSKMSAWTKVPDRVFCTNLVPNPATSHNSIEEQEARDRSAGLIRSYARRNGFGLLDFHRATCMARDGFDPTRGYVQQRNPITPVAGAFPAPIFSTVGFTAHLVIDGSKIPAQGATYQPVTVKYGYGSEEALHIYRDVASGQYRLRVYYGNSVYGDAGVQQLDQAVVLNNTGGQLVIKVERFGSNLAVYDMVGAYNSGEHRDPVLEVALVSMGGRFQFSAGGVQAGALVSCDFGQIYPALNKPIVKSNDLFGRPTSPNPNGEFGGSGFNHPSSLVADAIYRPVLSTSQFAGELIRRFGSGFEQYEAVIDGQKRLVTRNFGRLAINVTAAGTFNWSAALPVALAGKVLSARCGLGSLPGTTTASIYTNSSYGAIGAQANVTGSYTTTATSGVLLIDWEVIGY